MCWMLSIDQAGQELETDHRVECRGDLYQGFLVEKREPDGGFMKGDVGRWRQQVLVRR